MVQVSAPVPLWVREVYNDKLAVMDMAGRDAIQKFILEWQPNPATPVIAGLQRLLEQARAREKIITRERKGIERLLKAALRRRQGTGRRGAQV